jgi:glyoxylase-like metal-dependent hydrolase (beta-lactamase superfamily II)
LKPKVKSFYHSDTYTWTHLVICTNTNSAVLIDPVLDYNAINANTSTDFTDSILRYISDHDISLEYVFETHAHADHISSAAYIQDRLNTATVIGQGIIDVQKTFKQIFNLDADFKADGSQFSLLLHDGERVNFGDCQIQVMHTPGHTNDSMSYIIGEYVFIGDTLFSPDYGSARCDFPGGCSEKLYASIQKIYALGAENRLYLCHDYPPDKRQPQAWFSAKQQMQQNIHIQTGTTLETFVKLRNKRDKKLKQPRLIIPSIQINIAAGQLPRAQSNGIAYLKIPLNTIGRKN